MSVFVVGLVTIHDRGHYAAYEVHFREILTPFGGEILAVDDAVRVLEGSWPAQRSVILRFPNEDAAKQWYDGPGYQALMRIRAPAATATLAIISAR